MVYQGSISIDGQFRSNVYIAFIWEMFVSSSASVVGELNSDSTDFIEKRISLYSSKKSQLQLNMSSKIKFN
ncbi:hypothetical protein DERP_006623 [Dermatophagoides pteronyssinus]|uniref:Uncharacterized protein n=1 Tax=Dermatophagoides pteronyssinus TaxID=6956 RepID=A0ABQ8IQV0_DERPT|nr:hypothetical protein DERP_006623 [Dermatophagoides pteronyssinus]